LEERQKERDKYPSLYSEPGVSREEREQVGIRTSKGEKESEPCGSDSLMYLLTQRGHG